MALFSRRKPAEPATPNPFVAAGQKLAAQRERDAAEAAAARPVFEPRKGGRPTVENPRTRRVSMSLTEDEHAAWTAAAQGRGLSAWAREQVTEQLEAEQPQVGQPRGNGAEVARLRADLGRVGSNLNQLVRAVNSGHAPTSSELLEAVQATREELARVRGDLP